MLNSSLLNFLMQTDLCCPCLNMKLLALRTVLLKDKSLIVIMTVTDYYHFELATSSCWLVIDYSSQTRG